MERAIEETKRRREAQLAYNAEHGIVPRTVIKSTEQVRFITRVADAREASEARHQEQERRVASAAANFSKDPAQLIAQLEKEMKQAAADLDFEAAARLRDELFEIRAKADGNRSRARSSLAAIRVER
jgi:excinuclease ABC subunit B